MQRKNHNINTKIKNGFAMMTALIVIIVLVTVMALSIQLSSKNAHRVVNTYLYEQAKLLAKNAAEYTIYLIDKNATVNCPSFSQSNYDFMENGGLYSITVNTSYAYAVTSDVNTSNCTASNRYVTLTAPTNPDQNYALVKIDVTVDVNNTSAGSEPITIKKTYIEDITNYIK